MLYCIDYQVATLPVESMELVIMKSAVFLHKVHRVHCLPRGDLLALTSVMAVSQEWWKIITQCHPRNHRNIIRQGFRHHQVLTIADIALSETKKNKIQITFLFRRKHSSLRKFLMGPPLDSQILQIAHDRNCIVKSNRLQL